MEGTKKKEGGGDVFFSVFLLSLFLFWGYLDVVFLEEYLVRGLALLGVRRLRNAHVVVSHRGDEAERVDVCTGQGGVRIDDHHVIISVHLSIKQRVGVHGW